MGWRFYRDMLLLGLVYLMHSLHAMHGMPETYDDPYFMDKMTFVSIGVVTVIVGHLILKEEDKLKSTLD
jgi:hypothetical protein